MDEKEHQRLHEAGIAHDHHGEVHHHGAGHCHEDGEAQDQSAGHTHTHGTGHGHTHSHAHTKAVLNRLSRAIGHLERVRRMVEEGQDCSEVLIQLAAVRSALNNTGKVILKDHIEHCIVDAIEEGDHQAIVDLERAIDQFMK